MMRTAPIFGLLTLTLIAMALSGVLGGDDPEPIVEAYRLPIRISSTTTELPETTTTTAAPAERRPDVSAMGTPVGDLLGTTTTSAPPAQASAPPANATARAPSKSPSTPTTEPRAVGTPTTTAPPPTVPGGPSPEFEARFASMINSLRSGSGLAGLTRDGSLDASARAWAEQMASSGGISHSDLGRFLPPWSAAGENVAMGGSVDSVFSALVGSSGHKANMLGDYTHLGVGVWVDSSGVIWTTHVFTR